MADELLKLTQLGINKVLNLSIDMDGIPGTETKNAKKEMLDYLVSAFVQCGHNWNSSFNLIGIRMDDNYTNGFTDFGVITKKDEIFCFPMSTKPGIGKVLNPPTVSGVKGVAVMKEGQYVDLYEYNGAWWSGMPFLLQIGAVDAYRDSDLNTTITREVVQSDKNLPSRFKLNFHSYKSSNWSWNLDVLSYLRPDKTYSNLSEGCQVTKKDTMTLIEPLLKEMGASGKITYTLLHF